MRIFIRIIQGLLVLALGLFLLSFGLVWGLNYHPAPMEEMPIIQSGEASPLEAGSEIKILSWNVQYMAGKGYVFYYDLPNFSGPDKRPSSEAIKHTIEDVAALIDREKPDMVLLQEMDEGATRTDNEDQAARLQGQLKSPYPCMTNAFYHKSRYIPHPMIEGSVGLKLTTLSRFPISKAIRHQLSLMPQDWVSQQFYLKRCVLECRIPMTDGSEIAILNTHLDAFSIGTDTLEKQVAEVLDILKSLDDTGIPWLIGGDFNLLPPGQRPMLSPFAQEAYKENSELSLLCEQYEVFPKVEDACGSDYKAWLTHFPNHPDVKAPDRTIDYIFRSQDMQLINGRVIQDNTWDISDHLPLSATFRIPSKP